MSMTRRSIEALHRLADEMVQEDPEGRLEDLSLKSRYVIATSLSRLWRVPQQSGEVNGWIMP